MSDDAIAVNPWMVLPFGALLLLIALAPLLCPTWWHKHYPKAALALAVVTLAYYLVRLDATERVWETAREYFSFIALIGSLFVVAGGIHINVKGDATPFANVIFLLIGAIIANILGTTGASILLIRPWLRMNKRRIDAYHVVFFIFIVSNVGGCLTPIGDPPLFLGYLMGVPFWWVAQHCSGVWLFAIAYLLVAFLGIDHRNYLRCQSNIGTDISISETPESWRFEGLGNIFFLFVILMAVFLHHPVFLREGLMIAAAFGSYFTTRKSVHEANRFNFHPLQEVAILFIGIFATMMPALDWLQANAHQLKSINSSLLYWSSGALSSFLDNAPTYLCFFKTIAGRTQISMAELSAALANGKISAAQFAFNRQLIAISIASVFFGANTYIGNGPNFMVKAMAGQEKVPTPGFLAFIWKYTLPIMLPMLIFVWWIFLRD